MKERPGDGDPRRRRWKRGSRDATLLIDTEVNVRRYAVILEPVHDPGMEGYYYAHVPSADLTTHGEGIEGALQAARDLLEAWIAEKNAHGETVPEETGALFAHIEIGDAVSP